MMQASVSSAFLTASIKYSFRRQDHWTDLFGIAEGCAEVGIYADPESILNALRQFYKEGVIEFRSVDGTAEWRLKSLARIEGLGWRATRPDSGMFLDHREGASGRKSRIIAWLNSSSRGYYLRPTTRDLHLVHPIPNQLSVLDEAVEWVYNNSVWRREH